MRVFFVANKRLNSLNEATDPYSISAGPAVRLLQLSSAEDGLHTHLHRINQSLSFSSFNYIHPFSQHWVDYFANVTGYSYKLQVQSHEGSHVTNYI